METLNRRPFVLAAWNSFWISKGRLETQFGAEVKNKTLLKNGLTEFMGCKAGSQGREKVYVHACVCVQQKSPQRWRQCGPRNAEMEMTE